MLQLYRNIKARRLELGYTQTELALKLGYSDKSMIAKIEKGLVDISQSKILAFADALNIDAGELMGFDGIDEIDSPSKGVQIPVLGYVAAGIPIEAIEDIIDMEEISEALARSGSFFGLRIQGDSMSPAICDGDVVIVRQQEDAENGDIVIAQVNGDEATCKRLRKYKDGIELISNNPAYPPFEYSTKDIETKPVVIIGKVIELRRKF